LQDRQVIREGESLSLDLEAELAKVERRVLEEALKRTEGNKVLAAQLLGIHRASLYRKLERHHLTDL
jgi:transcriptional regulator with PAS, ATPase and Fis domain